MESRFSKLKTIQFYRKDEMRGLLTRGVEHHLIKSLRYVDTQISFIPSGSFPSPLHIHIWHGARFPTFLLRIIQWRPFFFNVENWICKIHFWSKSNHISKVICHKDTFPSLSCPEIRRHLLSIHMVLTIFWPLLFLWPFFTAAPFLLCKVPQFCYAKHFSSI